MDPRVIPVELRGANVAGGSPGRLVGVLLPLGRVAGDRREVFTPGSVSWPHNGMRLLREHLGRQIMRFTPVEADGEIRIDAELPDTAEGREAADLVRTGARAGLSVEFHAVNDALVSGVREVPQRHRGTRPRWCRWVRTIRPGRRSASAGRSGCGCRGYLHVRLRGRGAGDRRRVRARRAGRG